LVVGQRATIHVKIKKQPAKKTKFYIDEMIKAYNGTSDRSLFDPGLIRDGIMFGEDYPLELQKVLADLCRYRQGTYNFDQGRCDFTYIRTPRIAITDFNDILDWADGFGINSNMNMHAVIGSWMFNDSTTGSVERFSAFFDYLGERQTLYRYLTSYTPDSFASGTYSRVVTGLENTQRLVPDTMQLREELAKRDIMFYARRSDDGTYALSEDSAYIPNLDSVMKSVGSGIQFNRIMNILYCFIRDNKIINPTTDNINFLVKQMSSLISGPAAHFSNKVTITGGISPRENEAARDVVLYDVRVEGHGYSRHNRLEMNIERPATAS